MYMSYMLPDIEYASMVWNGCSEQDSQTLKKIQNEAAGLVSGLTRSVSLENLYKESGWATLSQRRHRHNLGMVLSYIQDLIPPLVSAISDYPSRKNKKIYLYI